MADFDTKGSGTPDHATAFQMSICAGPLQRVISLARVLVDECRLEVAPKGLRIRAMDPATVAAVRLELDSDACERYETEGGLIGVDLQRLERVLGMADETTSVRIRLETGTRRVRLAFADVEYTLGLINPETVRSPPDSVTPQTEAIGEVVTTGRTLQRATTVAETLADHVTLAIDPDAGTFVLETQGDTDEFRLVRSASELGGIEGREARSLFAVDYLREIARELPDNSDITVRLGTDQPMVADFEFSDGNATARYAVAPRIQRAQP